LPSIKHSEKLHTTFSPTTELKLSKIASYKFNEGKNDAISYS